MTALKQGRITIRRNSDRAAEPAELIRRQAADDAKRRVYPGRCEIQDSQAAPRGAAEDGPPGLDRFVDPSLIEPCHIMQLAEALDRIDTLQEAGEMPEKVAPVAPELRSNLATVALLLIGEGDIWDARHVSHDPRRGPCPSCGDDPPSRPCLCLVCSRTNRDRTPHPARGTPTRPAPKAKYDRRGRTLRGGVG